MHVAHNKALKTINLTNMQFPVNALNTGFLRKLLADELFRVLCVIKSSEVIVKSLCSSDLLNGSVLFEKELRTPESAVIVVTHGKSVSTCIVNRKVITHVDLRKHSVYGKLIVILAKAAGYIVL